MPIPRGFRLALRNAMAKDGWPDSNPANYCDISAALRKGFTFAAAHLLSGATECRNTTDCLREWGGMPKGADGWPVDWPQWSEWFAANTVKCPKCGAFCFNDEGHPGNCGNCLAEIPEPDPRFPIETGLAIAAVRDPAFSGVDDPRAAAALVRLFDGADGQSESVTLSSAECADITAMLQSADYLARIGPLAREPVPAVKG